MTLRRMLAQLRPELVAYAQSLTMEASAAEDLAHAAAVRALQSGSAPPALKDLRPWMFRVIKNLLIDTRRRETVQREYSLAQGRLSDSQTAAVGDPVETLMVRQAFAALAVKDREILCLVDMLGLTYAEAAAALDIPAGTVMSRLSRARRAMIAQMDGSNIRPLQRRKG